MALKSLKKTFLSCKTSKRLREDLHLKETEDLQLQFSNVNSLRKGILGPSSQEETCLKFSQTERNFKAVSWSEEGR